jgi:predicted transposase YdaD
MVDKGQLEYAQERGREEGRQEGRQEGKEELLSMQIEQRFSTMPDHITRLLDLLTSDQMNELGKALFSFTSLAELESWLLAR